MSAYPRTELRRLLGELDDSFVMSPDAEEALAEIAEDFVESVTDFAIKLARHRKSDTVDVADIQCFLERTYRLRLPDAGAREQPPQRYHRPRETEGHRRRLGMFNEMLRATPSSAPVPSSSQGPSSSSSGPGLGTSNAMPNS